MRVIRGTPGSGKTALVFREFREAVRQGDRTARIIVPTATLVRHFQHELARSGAVFAPGSVVSLNRFVRELAATAEKPVTAAPEGLVRAIVRQNLNRLKLPEFAEVSSTAGMASVVMETIAWFENAGATPEGLAAVRKLSPRGKAFARVWQAVDAGVKACGFVPRGELMRAAAAQMKAGRVWMDGFFALSPLERELVTALGRKADLTLTVTDSPATDELRRFAMQLGADDRLITGVARKPRTVIVKADSPEREADEIARRIIELHDGEMHDGGTRFRDIGVALRDTEVTLPLLRCTLDRFGIPARFYFARSLRGHPAELFLSGLVRCALNGWDFATVIETLRAHPRWGHSAGMDRLDFALRDAMPGRGSDAVLALCALCDDSRLAEAIGILAGTERWSRERARPGEWLARMERLAETSYRPGVLEAASDYAGIETARGHVTAVRGWLAAMESAAAMWLDPDQTITLEEFWMPAEEAIESAAVETPDLRGDVVHVMNAYEARQWNVSALFVCGMSDRDYPRCHAQNLLFPDAEVAALGRAGIPLRGSAEMDSEERWLFEALKTRATDTLVLSYAEHDSGGRSVEASRFLRETDGERVDARPVRSATRGVPAGKGVRGRIASQPLLEALSRVHETVSLTALEDLAQCRFRFFSRRTLGLSGAPERPEQRLQARVTGLILHEALELWQIDQSKNFVEVFEKAFEDACRKHHLPNGYQLEVARIRFREIAREVRAEDLWVPDSTQVEVEFELPLPGGVTATGRIDRLDRIGTDCIIVDYKSGKTANVEKLVGSRTKLQGPLYALAARETLGLNPVAVIYWAVRDNELFGWGRVPNPKTEIPLQEMPENFADAARDRAAERLADYLAGAIQAHPEEAGQCQWCDFKDACRVEQPEFLTIEAAGV